MKILFIYPNSGGYGRIPLGLSILITILLKKNHEVELFDTTFILNTHTDNTIREKAGLVLSTDISHLYTPHSNDYVDEMLKEKINKFSPDLVGVSIVEDNYEYADHLIRIVKSIDKNITVIVGGTTPTVAPEVIIENPHIDFLVQGEGEEAVTEFCSIIEKGKSVGGVRNLWYKKNGEVRRNTPRPFVDMDTLPVQNLDLWDPRHFVKPYDGKLYRTGYFEMSRGCLHKCSYCVNVTYQNTLRNCGKYHREKSIRNAINEIKTLADKYNFERIFFCDDNFLLMSRKRMDEFLHAWKSGINIPYWINTTIESINQGKLSCLKETGCCGIGLGIETGSEWLRKNILHKNTSNNSILKAVDLIHENGIRTTANIMVGFPGEYLENIFESINFVKRIKPKSCDLNFVAPYIGTPIYAISKKLNYLELWDKPGFNGMVKNITVRRNPVINITTISHEQLVDMFYKFMDYVEDRLPVPEEITNSMENSQYIPEREKGRKEVVEAFNSLNST